MTETPAPAKPGLLKRTWPWLVGLVILGVIATRVPVDAFRAAIGQGPHLLLGVVTLLVTATVLCTDSFSTWIGLRAVDIHRPLPHVIAVRGATYVLFLVNYALGQGGFGYYLHRTGLPGLRAVGVTLFLIGTNLATLLLLTTGAWAVQGADPAHSILWSTLLILTAAFFLYLVIIVLRPRFIADRQIFTPLFDAGLRGHAIAMIGRLPHTVVIVLGHWVAMRAWGIPVPLWAGITLMPAVAIASVLPISPSGLGTTQAAMVYFFALYASGATGDERGAHVFAFAIVYFVYGVVASLVVGLACTPFAKRFGVMPRAEAPPPATPPGG